MDMKQRMHANLPYKAWLDGLSEERAECKRKIYEFNNCHPDDRDKMDKILRLLLGKTGDTIHIEQPFHCDYGYNLYIGSEGFINFDCVILDGAPVRIGNHVLIGPAVQIYTFTHPMDYRERRQGIEQCKEIAIGDDCWIGGGAVICPGVILGQRVVVGAGSVVTKSFPDDVVVAGNPARVIRRLDF